MWKLTENYEWQSLAKQFDWVKDMETIPQDAHHHAEGNVTIHTAMVLDSLFKTADYHTLSNKNQEILKASALMHDIEKRSTTVIESNGRITSY